MNLEKKIFFLKEIGIGYNEKTIFSGVNLEISAGSMTAICGPSGAGKTTLLKILAGLLLPDTGSIEFMERKISEYTPRDLSSHRSYVSQHLATDLEMSVEDIFETAFYFKNPGKKAAVEQIEHISELMNLKDLLRRNYSTLSGGEKRRVMLARGFLQSANVILLDEPTVFLDVSQSRDLIKSLHKINEEHNSTVICVTHDLSMVYEYFSHVILVAPSRDVVHGETEKILLEKGSEYFNTILETGKTPGGRRYVLA